jgi:hypothetical protein
VFIVYSPGTELTEAAIPSTDHDYSVTRVESAGLFRIVMEDEQAIIVENTIILGGYLLLGRSGQHENQPLLTQGFAELHLLLL